MSMYCCIADEQLGRKRKRREEEEEEERVDVWRMKGRGRKKRGSKPVRSEVLVLLHKS